MAFRKKYARRRFTRRRRATPWYRKRYSALQLAAKAAKGVWYLKGLVNSELHKRTISDTATNITDDGALVHLSAVAQGDSHINRTGLSMLLRYVNVRGTIYVSPSQSPIVPQVVRIMLIRDKQQLPDTPPTVANVLDTTSGRDAPFSFLAADTVGRFDILYSKRFTLNAERPSTQFSITKSMRSHVRYNGNASTDIQKNGLYLLYISSVDSAANPPRIDYNARVSFHDN